MHVFIYIKKKKRSVIPNAYNETVAYTSTTYTHTYINIYKKK